MGTWRSGQRGFGRAAMLAAVAALIVPAGAAAAAWTPEKPTYAVGERANVPVTMHDGTVLRVDVYYPVGKVSGKPADGPFPVVMTQSPYGKDSGLGAVGNELTGAFPYLVQRGYIDVVADVRGTGDSQGSWGLFDPTQAADGAELVRWAARLPDSSGRVGLYGESYLGINQFLTAGAVGPHSPLKAIFPVVPANDIYRDAAFMGGVSDLEFDGVFLGLTAGLNLLNPIVESARSGSPDPADTLLVELAHAAGLLSYHASTLGNVELGGDQAYDGSYWQARNPRNTLARIARNRIPAFMVGGWFDLFQRGTPLDYSGLQNAFAGRPVGAPMAPGQRPTGRYQLLMGPWYHVTAPDGIDLQSLQLAWFDRWLKGEPTGIANTETPAHLFEIGANRYVDTSRYPFDAATPRAYYLGDGSLGTTPPSRASAGADQVLFTGAADPCARQTEQWGAGAGVLAFGLAGLEEPCADTDAGRQAGPGALTYTTAPLEADSVLAGPIDATIFATSTRPDAFFQVAVEDVAPDGSSTPLTTGGLLGSLRALDHGLTWTAADGNPTLPYHPYTRPSAQAVKPGTVTRFDVEVYPTFARIPRGDRLRVTITTGDSPHLGFTPSQLVDLAGGVYQVQRNPKAASFVELPLAPADAFTTACTVCIPAG